MMGKKFGTREQQSRCWLYLIQEYPFRRIRLCRLSFTLAHASVLPLPVLQDVARSSVCFVFVLQFHFFSQRRITAFAAGVKFPSMP
jgi:hypothetical protein